MRVPPDQSCTARTTSPTARSGSRLFRSRVVRVSRVPKTKLSTGASACASACAKCSSMREYLLIEPEMSASSTSGAGRVRRVRQRRSQSSPPWRAIAPRVLRQSTRPGRLAARVRRVSSGSKTSFICASRRWAWRHSSAVMVSKSAFCSRSR